MPCHICLSSTYSRPGKTVIWKSWLMCWAGLQVMMMRMRIVVVAAVIQMWPTSVLRYSNWSAKGFNCKQLWIHVEDIHIESTLKKHYSTTQLVSMKMKSDTKMGKGRVLVNTEISWAPNETEKKCGWHLHGRGRVCFNRPCSFILNSDPLHGLGSPSLC